jgi:hypothetical protein
MPTTTTHPETVSALADIVTAYHDAHGTCTPSRATYDAVARALGVADTCTGNPDTATESVTHTPKKGLELSFYSVNPTHRTETDKPMTAYYVAKWNGEIYRGHVEMSARGYHADNANGFTCFDTYHYSAVLPDGCRKLVAQLVTDAVISAGVSLDDMRAEWAAAANYYEISSHLYAAVRALDSAARVEKGGR